MPAQKRKHRPFKNRELSSNAVGPPARRHHRRSPVPLLDSSLPPDNDETTRGQEGQEESTDLNNDRLEFKIDTMHTITHHTSFLPTMSCILSSSASASASSSSQHNVTTSSRPYALYHPRNLGTIPPAVITETRQEGKKDAAVSILDCQKNSIPHSAGCRMKFLPSPSFRPLPVHPDYHKRRREVEIGREGKKKKNDDDDILASMEGLTCPTVMNHSDNSCSGQVAVGNTGGYVTLYATVPDFLSVATLETSGSKRFWNMISKTKYKKKKRIGRSQAIVGSSIDRSNAIEVIVLLPKRRRVVVGTRLEVECISFENEIQWTWSAERDDGASGVNADNHDGKGVWDGSWKWMGWDGLSRTKMARGHPTRLHGSWGDEFVLASYGFFPLREEEDSKSTEEDSPQQQQEKQQNQQQEDKDDKHQRPDLFSPILQFHVDSGKVSNIVPFEPVQKVSEAQPQPQPMESDLPQQSLQSNVEWVECRIGSRAMAIFDKSQKGNIVGVFITQESSTDNTMSESTSDCWMRQELMVLDAQHRIIARTTIPSKSSGAKLITVEAMNQSPHGDFTIAANAKGGIRLYRTDGLQLLGVYGEGVSLHGHSILWQDIFFIRHDSGKRKNYQRNNESFEVEQEQWGNILERTDELVHRDKYETFRRKKDGAPNDELQELYIVSIPNAFREPYDMKEHIQFWDLSTVEFDGGNKLPSFELLAPKKSEGICTLIYDDSYMTSNSGRFLMSTHAGDCLELSSTMVTDWAGQMYPTGYLVIDNNITYIEDEDELDQVVDSHIGQADLCQNIASTTSLDSSQNEKELKLVLQMSMQDEPVDVIGGNEEEWRSTVINVAPCRPKPYLKSSYDVGKGEKDHEMEQHEGSSSPQSAFALMKTLPTYNAAKEGFMLYKDNEKRRQSLIEETKLKMQDGNTSVVPKRKQGNIEYIINNSVDKQLMIKMLENMSYADGSGSSLREEVSAKETKEVTSEDQSQDEPDNKKKPLCPACEGRYVIHTCGIRATPIDYDAIAEAERKKQEKEEAEKKRLLQEKRKAAEQKRKEKKMKKMREEQDMMQKAVKEKEQTVQNIKESEAEVNTQKHSNFINGQNLSSDSGTLKVEQMGEEWQNIQERLDDTPVPASDTGDLNHHNGTVLPMNKHEETLNMGPLDAEQTGIFPPTVFSNANHNGEGPDEKDEVDFKFSLGSISFGDSLLSNIPALPPEDLNEDHF